MLDISDFLNFKKYSVLEHINEFLNSTTPFGISTSDAYDGYTIFPYNDFQISVKKVVKTPIATQLHNELYSIIAEKTIPFEKQFYFPKIILAFRVCFCYNSYVAI